MLLRISFTTRPGELWDKACRVFHFSDSSILHWWMDMRNHREDKNHPPPNSHWRNHSRPVAVAPHICGSHESSTRKQVVRKKQKPSIGGVARTEGRRWWKVLACLISVYMNIHIFIFISHVRLEISLTSETIIKSVTVLNFHIFIISSIEINNMNNHLNPHGFKFKLNIKFKTFRIKILT